MNWKGIFPDRLKPDFIAHPRRQGFDRLHKDTELRFARLLETSAYFFSALFQFVGSQKFTEKFRRFLRVGDMIRLMPDATMAYARYDKTFTSDELQELAAHTKSGFTIDNLELVENLCAAGRKYSSEAVQIEHLT